MTGRPLRACALLALLALACATPAQASLLVFTTTMDGPSEAPPNMSPGTGTSWVIIDTLAFTMRVTAEFSGLLGNSTAAHIHGPTEDPFTGNAGVMTPVPSFPGFPLGVTSGSFSETFDLTSASSYNPAFLNNATNAGNVDNARASLINALRDGKAYFNLHSNLYPAGEIRGFYRLIPEPSTFVLASCASIGLALAAIRHRARPCAR